MPRIDFDEQEKGLVAQADSLEAQAKVLKQKAYDSRDARARQMPLKDRLIFAAYTRCCCGHGLAYDPHAEGKGPFKGPSEWDCSAVLLGIETPGLYHDAPAPFAFYEIKSENQPSANGATTREPGRPHPRAYEKPASA